MSAAVILRASRAVNVCLWSALCLAPAAVLGANAQTGAIAGPGSLSGIWLMSGYKSSSRYTTRQRVQHTVEDALPPLKPEAAKLLESRLAAAEQGEIFANTLTECLPGGVPQMVIGAANYPIQFLETPGQVTILYEEQNHFRIVHLNGRHPGDPDPGFMGHSIGRWEQGALVVDTVGLNDQTTIDQVGTPHSEALHVIERYRRVDATTMEVNVTIDDPQTFTRTWQARAVYKLAPAGRSIKEYVCENNRNAPDAQGHTSFEMNTAR